MAPKKIIISAKPTKLLTVTSLTTYKKCFPKIQDSFV